MAELLEVQTIIGQVKHCIPVNDLVLICKDYLVPELLFSVISRGGLIIYHGKSLHDAIVYALIHAFRFQRSPLQIDANQNHEFLFQNLCKVLDNRDYIDIHLVIDDNQTPVLRYQLINGLFYTSDFQQYTGFDSFAVYVQWKCAWLRTIGPIDLHDCEKAGHIFKETVRAVFYCECVICRQSFVLGSNYPNSVVKPYSGTQFVWHLGVLRRVISVDFLEPKFQTGKFDPGEFFTVLLH